MKPKTTLTSLFLLLTLLFLAGRGDAQTAVTYQGQLRDGSTNANGNYSLTFKLYDNAGGGMQIGSTLTAPNQPIVNGLFTVALDFGGTAFDGNARWLEITVQAGASSAETLTPRVAVLPAPYALFAKVSGTVTNGAIMNAQLATNSVATTNIQNSAVTNRNLSANAVATTNIQDNTITQTKIAMDAVATTNIQNNAVTTMQISNAAVTNSKLAANAVATANIQDAAVTDAKILSVSGGKVVGTVASAAIVTNGLWAINVAPHEGSTRMEVTKQGTNVMTVGNRVFIETHLGVTGDISTDGNLEVGINGIRINATNNSIIFPTATGNRSIIADAQGMVIDNVIISNGGIGIPSPAGNITISGTAGGLAIGRGVSVSGNVSATGNISATGDVSANTITANGITAINVSASNVITSGSIFTSGTVTANAITNSGTVFTDDIRVRAINASGTVAANNFVTTSPKTSASWAQIQDHRILTILQGNIVLIAR